METRATLISLFMALALLTLAAPPASAAPAIVISPEAGPAGTQFAATVTGLPGGNARWIVLDAGSHIVTEGQVPAIPADGTVRLTIDSTGYAAGLYKLGVQTAAQVLVPSATFTVTPPAAPGATVPTGPPATGGGGLAGPRPPAPPLALALPLLLAGVGVGRALRRRTRPRLTRTNTA